MRDDRRLDDSNEFDLSVLVLEQPDTTPEQHGSDVNLQLERGKRYLLKVGSKNRRFAYVTVAP